VESNFVAPTDQFAARQNFQDIKIQGHRILVEPVSDGSAIRVAFIASLLIVTGGFAWLAVGALPSVFLLSPESKGVVNLSSRIAETEKGDRLPVLETISHGGIAASSGEQPLNGYRPSQSDAKHSLDVQNQAIPTQMFDAHARETLRTNIKNVSRQDNSMIARPRPHHVRERLSPVPETGPTTIEGWTLREVVNGEAVLEGPNGAWKVARGDTVPGIGRVDSIFRWGNHLMVATSRGLIATR
jgi:hypothetical protein